MSATVRRTLSITNDARHLSQVRGAVFELLEGSVFDSTTRHKIVVAVDEALANVVEHAYREAEGAIVLEFELTPEHLRVAIKDNGVKFDPGERVSTPEDIQRSIKLGLKGGYGLFLMRQIMDEVRFSAESDHVNELVMVKRVPPPAGAAGPPAPA